MSEVRAWHRWLSIEGEARPVARAITGWSNTLFLFIVCSGFYLWFPRKWTWQRVRPVVLFSSSLRGKARDFNWHNVLGLWSCVPLFIVVLTAMPISFHGRTRSSIALWAKSLRSRVGGVDARAAAAAIAPSRVPRWNQRQWPVSTHFGPLPRSRSLAGESSMFESPLRIALPWCSPSTKATAGSRSTNRR